MSDLIKHQLANAPIGQLGRDSVTYIQSLEAENDELKKELEVAVEALGKAQKDFYDQGLHKQGFRVKKALATIKAKSAE